MPKFRSHQSSFTFGEVSRKVDGRTDLESYRKSCKQLKNFINYPSGGVTKRYGSKFITDLMAEGIFENGPFQANSIMIPYSFSNGEDYMIVLHPGSSGYALAIEMSTKRQFRVFNNQTVTGFTAGTNLYNGFTSSTDTSKFQYSQRGDFLHVTHPDLPPFIVQRQSAGNFVIKHYCGGGTLTNADTWEQLPYKNISNTGIGLQINTNTVGSGRTITANAALFDSTWVGTTLAIHDGSGTVGYCTITAYSSSTSVTVYLHQVLAAATTDYTAWYESAWSPKEGWPRTVSHVNSRVVYGGTQAQPDTFWFSQEGDVFQMSQEEVDHDLTETRTNDDHFNATLNAGKLSEINWVRPNKAVVAFGTNDFEYTMFAPDNTTALGALNFQISTETAYGSEHIQTPVVGSRPLMVQRGGQRIRDFFYSREANGYVSNEITTLAEHFARKSLDTFDGVSLGKVKQMAFQKANDEVVWVIDSNNYLYGFTRSESNGILAFHDHALGGFSNSAGDEPPKVVTMAANKSPNGTHDELWMIVERNVNGSTKYTLEYIGAEFTGSVLNTTSVDIEDHPVFMDCAQLLRSESPTVYISFDTSVDMDTAGGTATGTATGSPSTPAGDLDLEGGTGKYVSYDGTDNVDVAQVGCVRFKYKPGFTATTLVGDHTLFSIAKADSDADNLIELYIKDTGSYETLQLIINDSTGSAIINDVTFGVLTGKQIGTLMESGMGADGYCEIELNYDLTAGATRIFINGTQIGETDTSTGTRDTTIDLLRIGSDYTGANNSDGYFKDFMFFDTVQHTANYKPTPFWDGSTSVKGLDVYESETIKVLNDGNVEADKTVASGDITLTESGSYALVGYGYTAVLELMEVEDGAAIGSAQGAIKRIHKAYPRFHRSANASVGSDVGDVDAIEFRDASESASDPITLKTGIRNPEYGVELDLGQNRQATFYLESASPLPCSVVGVTVEGMTSD